MKVQQIIPQPAEENPAPRVGDVWWTYRSMYEVEVTAIEGKHATLTVIGELRARSPRVSKVLIKHMANTKWFRCIRPAPEPITEPQPPGVSFFEPLLAEQRTTNAARHAR